MVTLAVCAGGKSGGKRKRAGSGGGKTKMAGDAQGAFSVSLHSASLLPLSSRSCVVRPRTADRSKNQQGGGGARIQTCAVTEGSLEQLLKAGEREFSRNPVAAEDCYRRAVAADKTSVLALYNLGLSQMNQRRHDDAISNFELVVSCCVLHVMPSCHALTACVGLRRCRFIPVMARRISDLAALFTTRRVPRLHQDKPADTRNCSREQSPRSSGRSS
ncbi:MAG: tetratricopeptide repeat protein [Promethearchaeia archaeon]